MDNWIASRLGGVLRSATDPLVVDLGYGDSPTTAIELFTRLRRVRADTTVLGLEIDDERVSRAATARRDGLDFAPGGFELAGYRPVLVRAANVLRQYPEDAVFPAWDELRSHLQPGGRIVEGTSDELGRRATWVTLDERCPITFTIAVRLEYLARPFDVADRLVKALIHRNVPGERIHEFLACLDDGWDRNASLSSYGPRQRWQATVAGLARRWPILDQPARHRLGEVTVPWDSVAPAR
jgi:hypothetical protein